MSTSSDESFLARWSRLKRHPDVADEKVARADDFVSPLDDGAHPEAAHTTSFSDGDPAGVPADDAGDGDADAARDTKLRDFSEFEFEKLDFNSDYTQFMKDDVPVEARNKALRQLWTSNPVFANMDGLDDYCEDFSDAAMVPVGGVRTAYKIGKGFLSDAEVAEWDALGKPDDTSVASLDDQDENAEDRASEDPHETLATDDGDVGTGDRIGVDGSVADNASADNASAVAGTDPGGDTPVIEDAGYPGAACAAFVKQEEQAALDAYDTERSGAKPGAPSRNGSGIAPGNTADKDRSST